MTDSAEAANCGNCNSPVTKRLLCSVCKKAVYCSAQCQKEDWKYHSRICKKAPPPAPAENSKNPSGLDSEEMKRQLDEMTKGQDPALAKQVKEMMSGMMGVE